MLILHPSGDGRLIERGQLAVVPELLRGQEGVRAAQHPGEVRLRLLRCGGVVLGWVVWCGVVWCGVVSSRVVSCCVVLCCVVSCCVIWGDYLHRSLTVRTPRNQPEQISGKGDSLVPWILDAHAMPTLGDTV